MKQRTRIEARACLRMAQIVARLVFQSLSLSVGHGLRAIKFRSRDYEITPITRLIYAFSIPHEPQPTFEGHPSPFDLAFSS